MKGKFLLVFFIVSSIAFSFVMHKTVLLIRINSSYLYSMKTDLHCIEADSVILPSVTTAPSAPELLKKSAGIYDVDKELKSTYHKSYKTNTNSKILNIAFLGIDSSNDRLKEMSYFRTDTIIIIHIDPDIKKTRILSIPRDTRTFIPAINRMDKINHAYAYGSVKNLAIESSLETINNLIKYDKIDHFFAIDMEPIPDIIDALGGVTLDVEVKTKMLKKGVQTLDGTKALDYIQYRDRAEGDIARIKRQQKLINALYCKLALSDSVPDEIEIIDKYHEHIKTDLSSQELIELAKAFFGIDYSDISYYLLPGEGRYIDNVSYWVPNEIEVDKMLQSLFMSE